MEEYTRCRGCGSGSDWMLNGWCYRCFEEVHLGEPQPMPKRMVFLIYVTLAVAAGGFLWGVLV